MRTIWIAYAFALASAVALPEERGQRHEPGDWPMYGAGQ